MIHDDERPDAPREQGVAEPLSGDVRMNELTETELEHVVGGVGDAIFKLGDIKGESTDDKHASSIEIM